MSNKAMSSDQKNQTTEQDILDGISKADDAITAFLAANEKNVLSAQVKKAADELQARVLWLVMEQQLSGKQAPFVYKVVKHISSPADKR